MLLRVLILFVLFSTHTAQAQTMTEWEGTWEGTLSNYPDILDREIDVVMEIGPIPDQYDACATWKTTYSEAGSVVQVKDYRLCSLNGMDEFEIDEGDGVRLKAAWLGGVLTAPFKYGDTLLISRMRLVGEVLEHDIVSMKDLPASEAVVSMMPRNIQRLRLTKKQ